MWDSASKEVAIMEFVKKYNIDLNKSYAYGDTSGDFSMLKLVRYPFCVNPTKELLKNIMEDNITKENIQVIVERKDVIYKLNSDNIHIY